MNISYKRCQLQTTTNGLAMVLSFILRDVTLASLIIIKLRVFKGGIAQLVMTATLTFALSVSNTQYMRRGKLVKNEIRVFDL